MLVVSENRKNVSNFENNSWEVFGHKLYMKQHENTINFKTCETDEQAINILRDITQNYLKGAAIHDLSGHY